MFLCVLGDFDPDSVQLPKYLRCYRCLLETKELGCLLGSDICLAPPGSSCMTLLIKNSELLVFGSTHSRNASLCCTLRWVPTTSRHCGFLQPLDTAPHPGLFPYLPSEPFSVSTSTLLFLQPAIDQILPSLQHPAL